MSIEIINKDEITEKQMEDAILDFTYGLMCFLGEEGRDELGGRGAVVLDTGGSEGIILSKRVNMLSVERVDTEEKETKFPKYKYDLEEDELVYFCTKGSRYYEPCFEVYVQIQFWDDRISEGMFG